MKSAVIYARLSDVRKGDVEGIERQVREGEAHAKRLKAKVVERLVDNDVTAADRKKNRPAFQRLMAGMAENTWDVVILRSLERWVRRPAELEEIIEVASKSSVRVESIHGGTIDLSTRQGRMLARMMTNIAIDEVDAVTERVTDWHADRAARGLPCSGKAGYGFNADKVTVNEREAKRIREAAQRVLDGEALLSITRSWSKAGVTFHGAEWRPSTLRRILLAPRIAGLRTHNGDIVGPAVWPAIVDRATFDRVTKVLTSPSRRSPGSRGQKLLTGILTCGRDGCGQALNHKWDQKGPRYYCRHCLGTLIAADHTEDAVRDAVIEAVDDKALAKAYRAAKPRGKVDRLGEIAQLEADLADLAHQLGEGELTMAEWKVARAGIDKRIGAARAEVERDLDGDALAQWVGQGRALAESWESMGDAQKRSIITAVFDDIVVGPAIRGVNRFDARRLTFVWKV